MGRGFHRGRGRSRGKRGGGSRGRGGFSRIDKDKRSHFKEFGEAHPIDDSQHARKYRKVEDRDDPVPEATPESDSDSDTPATDYQALLTSLGPANQDAPYSDEDDESDEIEDESDDGENDEGDSDDVSENDVDEDDDEEGSDADDDIEIDKTEENEKQTNESLKAENRNKNGTVQQNDVDDVTMETDEEEEEEEDETPLLTPDPFSVHLEKEIEESLAEKLKEKQAWQKNEVKLPMLGRSTLIWPKEREKPTFTEKEINLKQLHVKEQLCRQASDVNTNYLKLQLPITGCSLTPLQLGLFSVMNTYKDMCYPERTPENAEEIRMIYCLHALNHVLKTRSRVIAHNAKLKAKGSDTSDDYRDQGLTRPKVLIVLPFRDAAVRVVNLFIKLLMPQEQTYVSNKKRFYNEYKEEDTVQKGFKPADFEATFTGNIDDHFRIGIGVAKKTLKLYTEFYNSDIILASPLGLRTVIGSEGEAERDFDFLSSIEMMIMDQTDVFLMQNWDHILHLMQYLHRQPSESHGVDFSRVRMWTLNGWSKFYRQSLIFSSVSCPEINSVFNRHCHNYAGKVMVPRAATSGSICQVVTQLPQVFHKISASSITEVADARFEFFIKKILPKYQPALMSQTLIFIPSYFDFVRIRNYFKKEKIEFVQLCEYSKDKYVNRARGFFYTNKTHFMLFTERFHFYKRYHIRGIRHVVFYGLPLYPHFYSEVCNMMKDPKRRRNTEDFTCSVLYSKYDSQALAGVVGTSRAGHMISSDKSVHMFATEDS